MSAPTPPYRGYLERLAERIARDIAEAEPLTSPHAGAPARLREAAGAAVEERADDLVALSRDLHAHPELGFEEHHAVEAVAGLVSGDGHDLEIGAYGLPTALRSRVGRQRPRVAVLAEYDALPGIGHACGHNIICASAVGAFLAVASVVADLDGSVELVGCPAEEGGGGKELIARAGGFDAIDAAVMVHPAGFEIATHPWIGVRQVDVTYRGLAAHASAMPFLGRNALDAVVAAYLGIAQLRQHILPTDRVHGIITDGGQKPNIVPERAAATFYLRSAEPRTLAELCERAAAVFDAAAASTGTVVEIGWDPSPVYLPVRHNHTLAARYAQNMSQRGRRVLPAGVVPGELTGSTDLGNVSVRVPAIHPTLAVSPPGVSIHTPEFAGWAGSEEGDRGTVDAAIGLALTAVDFLADGDLRAAVAQEFQAAGGRSDPVALLDSA
ncbi:MAG TPA: M20 family metallopeptidase [Egibacteraceae bacterium]|nr:M20 family metallopeptidase [Egibacteraceae bacterium]